MKRIGTLCLITAALLAGGCASKPTERPERSEVAQYKAAQVQLEKGNYLTAIDELRELESRYPYGDFAEQALLDLLYAQTMAQDYPAVIATGNRYLRTWPAGRQLDYVLYLRGLANYNMERGMLDRFTGQDRASRSLGGWKDAFKDFTQLTQRYPDSPYTPDALARMVHIRNALAENELHAARYYARRNALLAAVNRAQDVIRHYQETPAVEEAMAILVRAYRDLDEQDLARRSLAVMQHNWPDSPYVDGDRIRLEWWPEKDKGLLSLLTFDLL